MNALGGVRLTWAGLTVVIAMLACESDPAGVDTPLNDDPTQWVEVATGDAHTCALRGDGFLYCWGSNSHSQLGPASVDSTGVPILVSASLTFDRVRAGGDVTCGRARSAGWLCWGRNDLAQLGRPGPDAPTPQGLPGDYSQLTIGTNHLCGLDSTGIAYCWGSNFGRKLGYDTNELCGQSPCSSTPRAVPGLSPLHSVSAGLVHTCGVTRSGEALCWGSREWAQGGAGVRDKEPAPPTPVSGSTRWRTVQGGSGHSCGINDQGTLYCWGGWYYQSRGAGPAGESVDAVPIPIAHAGPFSHVVTNRANAWGAAGSCGIDVQGSLYCWGTLHKRQLGFDAPGTPCWVYQCTANPMPVDIREPVETVALGRFHGCATTVAGALWCWGNNDEGQLGIGSIGGEALPVEVRVPN